MLFETSSCLIYVYIIANIYGNYFSKLLKETDPLLLILLDVSYDLLLLAQRNIHAMSTNVSRLLCGFPAALLQHALILESIHLHFEGTAAFDHFFLAVLTEPPKREITSRAST